MTNLSPENKMSLKGKTNLKYSKDLDEINSQFRMLNNVCNRISS